MGHRPKRGGGVKAKSQMLISTEFLTFELFGLNIAQYGMLGDAFKKKVNFGTLAQKGGGGQSKIPNVDQY